MLKRSVSISFWQPELPKPPTATPTFQSALLKLLACRRVLFFLCCFFYYSVERGGAGRRESGEFFFSYLILFFFCFALFCCILCRCIDLKFVILLCLLSFSSRFNFASYLRFFFFFFSLVLDMLFLLALLVEGNAFETFRYLSFGWLGLENFIKFVMTVFSLVLFVLFSLFCCFCYFRFFVKTQNIEMKKCTKM